MEIQRTKTGEELFSARTQVVWAAKAAGLQAIDSIFADVNDMDGLRAETELVKRLGFTGKSLVNPRQIEVVHEVFRPKPEEIDARARGHGGDQAGAGDGHGRHLAARAGWWTRRWSSGRPARSGRRWRSA